MWQLLHILMATSQSKALVLVVLNLSAASGTINTSLYSSHRLGRAVLFDNQELAFFIYFALLLFRMM